MRGMSYTDPIDQVGRTSTGDQLSATSSLEDDRVAAEEFAALMATVTEDEVAHSPGAAMDDGALFEACKRAGVPGLIVGDERMTEDDMRRALVAAVKRDLAAQAAARSTPPPAPDPLPPSGPIAAPAPRAPEAPVVTGLDPSRNGKYRIAIAGGLPRKYVSMGGQMQPVFAGGEVDLRTFPQRDVDSLLAAGIELVPDQPVFTRVPLKVHLRTELDVEEFTRRVRAAADQIAFDMVHEAGLDRAPESSGDELEADVEVDDGAPDGEIAAEATAPARGRGKRDRKSRGARV